MYKLTFCEFLTYNIFFLMFKPQNKIYFNNRKKYLMTLKV